MRQETATLSLGKARAAHRRVVVLRRKLRRGPQLQQNSAIATVTNTATNPHPTLVSTSKFSRLVVNIQISVLLHIVGWHVDRQIDDNSLLPRKKGINNNAKHCRWAKSALPADVSLFYDANPVAVALVCT